MFSDHNEKYSDRMERSYKAFAVTFELKFPFPLMKMFEFQLKIHKFVPECVKLIFRHWYR